MADVSATAEPDLVGLAEEAHPARHAGRRVRDPDDKFLPDLTASATGRQRLRRRSDDAESFAMLRARPKSQVPLRTRRQLAGLPGLKADCAGPDRSIGQAATQFTDATLRPLADGSRERVVECRGARAAEGRLEFHDLLVLARRLLRTNAEVRAALHDEYPRLLLDEFQDTDPIQIELAVRLAAGSDGDAADWRDVARAAGVAVRRRRPEAVDLPVPPRRHPHLPGCPGQGRRAHRSDHQLPHRRSRSCSGSTRSSAG